MRHGSQAMRSFRMFTVETSTGVDLVPPVTSETLAIEAATLSSRIVRGSVHVNARLYGGTLARYIGSAFAGEFCHLEA